MLPDAERKLASPRWRAFARADARRSRGLPRHISQHPGGMVISTRPLVELVPVQPAAMAGRQICQWDKDSCADAGFLKIDLLGLGMLSAVEECVDLDRAAPRRADRPLAHPARRRGRVRARSSRPTPSACFQIESRAQMQTPAAHAAGEPRRPHRPGRARPAGADPGQGRAPVHRAAAAAARGPRVRAARPTQPLLQSRCARRSASSSSRTRCSTSPIHLAGFSVGEAEGLRRAMSRKRSHEAIEACRARGSSPARSTTASTRRRRTRSTTSSSAFSGFGFPKSHAAAFGAARLPVGVAAPPLPARVPLRAPERAADGLLSAGDARARRAAARGRDAPAARQPQRGGVHDRGRRGARRARSTCRAWARRTRPRSSARRPYASIRRARAADAAVAATSSMRSSQSGACDAFGPTRRELLWRLGLVPRAQTVPGSAARRSSSRCRSSRRWRRPSCRSRPNGSGCSPTTARRASRSACTRSSCCARTCRRTRSPRVELRATRRTAPACSSPGWWSRGSGPSTANGVVFMLLEDEHAQVNLIVSAAGLRALPRRSCAASRCCSPAAATSTRTATATSLVDEIVSLAPLASELTEGADVHASLPAAHHFGHR